MSLPVMNGQASVTDISQVGSQIEIELRPAGHIITLTASTQVVSGTYFDYNIDYTQIGDGMRKIFADYIKMKGIIPTFIDTLKALINHEERLLSKRFSLKKGNQDYLDRMNILLDEAVCYGKVPMIVSGRLRPLHTISVGDDLVSHPEVIAIGKKLDLGVVREIRTHVRPKDSW